MGEEYQTWYVLNVKCIACEGTVFERSIKTNDKKHLKHMCPRSFALFVQDIGSDLLSMSLLRRVLIRW